MITMAPALTNWPPDRPNMSVAASAIGRCDWLNPGSVTMQAYWTRRYNAVTIAMLARTANGRLRCGLAVSPLAMGPFSRPKKAKSSTDVVVVKLVIDGAGPTSSDILA